MPVGFLTTREQEHYKQIQLLGEGGQKTRQHPSEGDVFTGTRSFIRAFAKIGNFGIKTGLKQERHPIFPLNQMP